MSVRGYQLSPTFADQNGTRGEMLLKKTTRPVKSAVKYMAHTRALLNVLYN
jgi:hypothetical protein